MTTMAAVMTERRMGTTETRTATDARVGVAKNILLFFAAPLIGLAYIVAFPFVGCYALARAAIVRR